MSRRVVVRVPGVVELLGRDGIAIAVEQLVTASCTLDAGGRGPLVEHVGIAASVSGLAGDDPLLAGVLAACNRAGRALPTAFHARVALKTVDGLGTATAKIIAGAAGANALLTLGLGDEDVFHACLDAGAPPDAASAALSGGVVIGRRPEESVQMSTGAALDPSLSMITSTIPSSVIASLTRIHDGARGAGMVHGPSGSGAPVTDEQRWAFAHALATGDEELVARTMGELESFVWPSTFNLVRTAAREAGALGVLWAPRSAALVIFAPSAIESRSVDAVWEAQQTLGIAATTEARTVSVDGHRVAVQQLCEEPESTATAGSRGVDASTIAAAAT